MCQSPFRVFRVFRVIRDSDKTGKKISMNTNHPKADRRAVLPV